MKCPRCGNVYASKKVTNTRVVSRGYRIRRRVCSKCGERFKTVEVVMEGSLRVAMKAIRNQDRF
ncbi:MAG: hypothetical protein JRJ26_19490 [Deltaproteobacteria bacterium]|nr:hypothetical protein [Deltaproteobacteria bacterium]